MKDGKPVMEADGVTAKTDLLDPDILKYGPFLQSIFEFLIIAFALFMVVKAMNSFKKKTESAEPPPPPEDVVLLREIRDALKK
jgi:large conductance mechanosensitive channel